MKYLLTIVTLVFFVACNEVEVDYECGKPDLLEYYFDSVYVIPYDLSDRNNKSTNISKYDFAVDLDLSYYSIVVEEGDGLMYSCGEYEPDRYVDDIDHYNLYVLDSLEENRTNANEFFVLTGSRTTLQAMQDLQDDSYYGYLNDFYLIHHDSVPQTLFVELELISLAGDTLYHRTDKIKLIP